MQPQSKSLKIWAPGGLAVETSIASRVELVAALKKVAEESACRVSNLDYKVGDGLRIIGDASALAQNIDVCGLHPSDNVRS